MNEYVIDRKIIHAGIILGISLAIAMCTYSFWSVLRSFTLFGIEVKTFYFGTALSFVGYTVAIKLLCQVLFKKIKIKLLLYILLLSECAVIAATNGLFDELFFDPTKLGKNEYIGIFLMFVYTIFIYTKKNKQIK